MPLESNYILQGFQLPLSQKFGENSIKAMVMSSTIDSKQPKHERFDLSDCFGSPPSCSTVFDGCQPSVKGCKDHISLLQSIVNTIHCLHCLHSLHCLYY